MPEASVRAARVRTRRRTHFPLSVDENSISHIPGAQVVQVKRLPRRRRSEGVRRDPGCCAAQGRVEERPEVRLPDRGNYWSWLRTAGDTNTVNPPRFTADYRSGGRSRAREWCEDRLGDLQVPLQRLHADRPARGGRRHQRTVTAATIYMQARRSTRPGRPDGLTSLVELNTPARERSASSGTRALARSVAARRQRSTSRQR